MIPMAILFNTGDEQINNLIRALDDPDEVIRRNAQITIRYLGNPIGMNALISHYAKSNDIRIVGPIPLPLSEWDYDFINSTFLDKPENFGQLSTQYLYALALDGTPKAKGMLHKMLETGRIANTDPVIINTLSSNQLYTRFNNINEKDLADAILRASNFLHRSDKEHASAKIISFNRTRDKSLIKIYVNNGVLAEEFYHIVIRRYARGWSLFSINLIGVS